MDTTAILARLRVVCPTLATRLDPSLPLRSCGFDSLEFVDLLCAVEAEFRVRLCITDITPELTVADLLTLIAARRA